MGTWSRCRPRQPEHHLTNCLNFHTDLWYAHALDKTFVLNRRLPSRHLVETQRKKCQQKYGCMILHCLVFGVFCLFVWERRIIHGRKQIRSQKKNDAAISVLTLSDPTCLVDHQNVDEISFSNFLWNWAIRNQNGNNNGYEIHLLGGERDSI